VAMDPFFPSLSRKIARTNEKKRNKKTIHDVTKWTDFMEREKVSS
jgi:hypothetical protein